MAVTIGATPDLQTVRINFVDVMNERVTKSFQLDGGVTDGDLGTILDSIDALSNAGASAVSVVATRVVTGFTAAQNLPQNSVAMLLGLTFEKANPLNAAVQVEKTFLIPAWPDALRDTDMKPVTNNAALNALIGLLEDNLVYEGVDGNLYPGGWTYNRSKSGFGSATRELDGF